jgi:integrase
LRLLILTGARLSEILSLEWRWINWEGGFARIPDSKTGPKTISLPQPALALLSTLREQQSHDGVQSKYVLPGKRRGTYFTGIQKPWGRIRTAAGLEDVRIHDLRHCYASVAVSSGTSLYLVGAVLGHRQPSTTLRYAHLAMQPVREVAERTASQLVELLAGQISPPT